MREPAVRSRASMVPKLEVRLNTNTPKPAKNRRSDTRSIVGSASINHGRRKSLSPAPNVVRGPARSRGSVRGRVNILELYWSAHRCSSVASMMHVRQTDMLRNQSELISMTEFSGVNSLGSMSVDEGRDSRGDPLSSMMSSS